MRFKKFSQFVFVITFLISFILLSIGSLVMADLDKREAIDFLTKKGHPKLKNQADLFDHELARFKNFSRLIQKTIQYSVNSDPSVDFLQLNRAVFNRFFIAKNDIGAFQIRLISEDGDELVRFEADGEKIIEDHDGENVEHRYYFQEFSKSRKLVYFSDMDLHIHDRVIQEPYIPTIRTITRLFYDNKQYMLVINFDISMFAAHVLKTTLYDIFLVEPDGYVNMHLDPKLFFAKQLKREVTVASLKEKGFHYIAEKKLENHDYSMVLGIKKTQLDHIRSKTLAVIYRGVTISFFVSIILSLVLASFLKRKFKDFNKKVDLINNDVELDIGKEFVEFQSVLDNLEAQHKIISKSNKNLQEQVEKELAKSRQQEVQLFEQAKMVSLGEMIANIAHQWRQPLSAITTNASNIQISIDLEMLDENELSQSLETINSQAQYLSETINTFRDFIKEDKELSEVVLQERIEVALNIVKATLDNNHILVKKEIDYDSPVRAKIVLGELAQVIINILNNAKDALLSNQIQNPWIEIRLESNEEDALILIEDNAGGVPEEIMGKIFDPYFTTKHESQGTGLGLHMSYLIVTNSLKGRLLVENSQNGAKFTIKIPLDR